MASNNKLVYAAEPLATGSCFVAPLGTAAPTSAVTPLNAAFVDLGHVGEDGFTETIDRSVDKKKNFGGQTVKVLQTDYTHTFSFVLLESLNADVLKAVYGAANVTVTARTSSAGQRIQVKKNPKKLPSLAWVIDTVDSELSAAYRNYLPQAKIISVGDVTIVHSDTIMYEIELEAFADAQGNHVYTYTDDGIFGS